jgi:hypothetical protein
MQLLWMLPQVLLEKCNIQLLTSEKRNATSLSFVNSLSLMKLMRSVTLSFQPGVSVGSTSAMDI